MAPVGGGMALVGADGSIGIYDGRLRLSRRLRADGVGVRGAGQLTHCCEWRGQLLLFTAGGTLAVDMATGRQYRPDSLQIAGAVACPGSSPGWQAVANGSGDVLTLRSDGLASRFNLLPGGRNPSQGGVKIRVAAACKALYIATNGNGLFCLDPARGAMPSRVEEPAGTDALSDMLLCIMATGDGTLLVGNEAAGVTCVIPGRQTQARYILPEPGGMGSLANTVRQIATRGDGKMFVSTKDNAIYDYNPATGGLLPTGRLRACAYAFFTDRHGHTYLGTRGDGLYVDGLRYATDETARHIPSNDIYDVAQDGRGRIYVATWDGGLLVADNPGQRPSRFRAMLNRTRDERRVRRVCIDGSGRAWVATCNGLYTADTRWSPDTTLAITILQPWWLRWWAWVVYAVALAALSAWLYSLWLRGFRLRQQVLTERRMGEFRLNLFTQIAHEFRTPLALIQGAADRLARNDGRPPSRSALQTVRRGTSRLLRQVNMLMEFRRISTGNARLQLVRGDIVGFVRGIYMDFFSAARQKEVAFTMVPFGRDYTMAFDRRMVETMVYNLLSNAIKYVPRRGSVTLRLRLDGRKVLISVEDSGPGLSEEQQKSLFSPFMHGYVGSGGMGIGLYTARQMALLHKGDLTYGRAAGLTVFTVELPADESVYAAGDYGAEPPADETGSPGAGGDVRELLPEPLNDVTVAIVEDDPDMMEQLRTEIGAYFRTECYPDGESAADGLAASGVALVVCDVMLPGIDGYELVRRLRHNAATASVPVIMLTALDDDEHALRGYKAGADDYMGKPCNFALLAAKAARLIAWRSHGRAEAAVGQPEAQGGVVTARADRVFMDSVRRVVEARLGEPGFGVDQLADAMCMGRTKLYGRMKELFGTTPNRYILDVRLEVAARLLSEGRLTASEAGYKVGMDNRSYFFKCFKEKYGVPPGKYARG